MHRNVVTTDTVNTVYALYSVKEILFIALLRIIIKWIKDFYTGNKVNQPN